MKKKDDKVVNKIANKEERQRKKRVRERKMEADSQKKSKTKRSPNVGFCACVKNKSCLIKSD